MSGFLYKINLWWVAFGLTIIGIAAGGVFWLSQSSLLTVENIEVEGNRVTQTETVLEISTPLLKGESLLLPSFGDIEAALLELPFVEEVELDRDFPDTVCIRIREYHAFVNLVNDSGALLLSSEGRVLQSLEAPAQNYPVLTTGEPCELEVGTQSECADVNTGVQFLADIPVNFNGGFVEVSVDGGDINARTSSGVDVHFGTIDDYGIKFEVLRQLLARSAAEGVRVKIDVSVPERPVTSQQSIEPSGESASQSGASGTEDPETTAEEEAAAGE